MDKRRPMETEQKSEAMDSKTAERKTDAGHRAGKAVPAERQTAQQAKPVVPDHGFTHSGIFHADDVFSTAMLGMLNPNFTVTRGTAVPTDFDGIVYDIGGGRFDHHMADKRVRDNGVPYAAFGLLWEVYGTSFLSEKNAARFDREFIQPMDQSDNTGTDHALSDCISDFLPLWYEQSDPESFDRKFEEAVSFASVILKNRFARLNAGDLGYAAARKKIEETKGPVLELDRSMPWKEACLEALSILYVIYPSHRGGYNVQAVPKRAYGPENRKPFPRAWRGKSPEELQRLTGIAGFHFCHNSGFLCVGESLEDARKIAALAVKS